MSKRVHYWLLVDLTVDGDAYYRLFPTEEKAQAALEAELRFQFEPGCGVTYEEFCDRMGDRLTVEEVELWE